MELTKLQQDRDMLISQHEEVTHASTERITALETEIAALLGQQEAWQSSSDEVTRLHGQVAELQRVLDSSSAEDTEKLALSEERAALLIQVHALRASAQEWEHQEFGARQERDACREELAVLQEQTDAQATRISELLSEQEKKTSEAT